jgi:hypothetical protein
MPSAGSEVFERWHWSRTSELLAITDETLVLERGESSRQERRQQPMVVLQLPR